MTKQSNSVFIIGYGNPGRQDDGLGPACVRMIRALKLKYVTEDISSADIVIFVDATRSGETPFYFSELKVTDDGTGFGSHTLTPNALKTLTNTVYASSPKCYVLGIRGYQFDQFEEKLSVEGEGNLLLATDFLVNWVTHK